MDNGIDKGQEIGPDPVEYRTLSRWPNKRFGSDGSVWSYLETPDEWRKLHPSKSKNGYKVIIMPSITSNPKDRTRHSVHRLVLEAFVGPCPKGMECRHLDGDRANNRIENLAWGTPKENSDDIDRHGTRRPPRGERSGRAKFTDEIVRRIFELDAEGVPRSGIAKMLSMNPGTVTGILCGQCWGHLGLKRKSREEIKAKRAEYYAANPKNMPEFTIPDSTVREVRRLSAIGAKGTEIAKQLGLTRSNVSRILQGKLRRCVQ